MPIVTSKIAEQQQHLASGDHELTRSDSGVELKSLLKLIDNVIEMSPATDDPEENIQNFPQKNPQNSQISANFPTFARVENHQSTTEILAPGYVHLTETLLVPVKKFPKYNFVGRILGPRGMTVKQLEKETGCKIFVRGRASNMAFNPSTKAACRIPPINQKTSLSNISKCALTEEPLHVFIESMDFPEIAAKKLAHAVSIIQDLLSPPADGKDELKRQQLVDISLINGTYRATSASNDAVRPFRRSPWRQTVDPTSNSMVIDNLELHPLKMDMDHPPNGVQHCGTASGGGGAYADFGTVYGIPQQRRVWQKPRGPDATSEEYAKSVSSREFVSDIVNKTKNSPTKNPPNHSSDDSMFQLSDSVVNETLKVAKNLLASHQHLTDGLHERQKSMGPMHRGAGDIFWNADFSIPPPPLMRPPLMHRPYQDYSMCYMYPPPPPPTHFSPRRFY